VHPILFQLGPILVPAYGVLSAVGVLLGLAFALHTARLVGLAPRLIWNLCILVLFAAPVGSRLLLIVVNWVVFRSHPAWIFSLAMIHHPLVAAAGVFFAALAAWIYTRVSHLPLRATADALAAPLALGLACEQVGALMAGSGVGTPASARWAVVYTSPFAAIWSGAPLGVPVHPVQAYAATAFLVCALLLLLSIRHRRQAGDTAGLALLLFGTSIYFTEFLRDPEGRGLVLHGALDGPQVAAIACVLLGGLVLLRRESVNIPGSPVAGSNG
jgi:phosphatidylglycerol---prolipoprotein diacylglyceryl transferase